MQASTNTIATITTIKPSIGAAPAGLVVTEPMATGHETDNATGPDSDRGHSSEVGAQPAPSAHGFKNGHFVATMARVIFIILALLAFAYLARAVVLPLLLACVVAMMLKAPVRWLTGLHVPTPLAAAMLVCVLVATIAFGVVYLGRPAVDWLAAAPDNLPRLKAKFHRVLRPAVKLTEAASSVGELASSDTTKQPPTVSVKDNRMANTMFSWTSTLLAGAGETVALVFLLLASGDLFMLKLVRVMPRLRDKKHAVEISREIQQSISTYLFSVGLINVGFGIVVGIALYLLGLPNSLMWGGVAAFANFVPYIGPILGVTAVALAGLLEFDSLVRGLLPAGAYCALHLIEANAVTPYVLGRRFALNPVLIFLVLIFCASMWGVIGALLAVPLLVTIKVISERIPALSSLSEFLAPHAAPDPGSEGGPGRRSLEATALSGGSHFS